MVKKTTPAIVYIDGENLLHRVEETLKDAKLIQRKEEVTSLRLRALIELLFPEYPLLTIRYYGTKIRTYDINDAEVKKHAQVMVESQRRFKRNLENQRITFIAAGSLRVRETKCSKCHKTNLVFKEKGVDVRCAVDIVEEAAKGQRQIIVSSDSDLLPALKTARHKGSKITYVHHASMANFAMMKSAHDTRVFTPQQIIRMYDEAIQ